MTRDLRLPVIVLAYIWLALVILVLVPGVPERNLLRAGLALQWGNLVIWLFRQPEIRSASVRQKLMVPLLGPLALCMATPGAVLLVRRLRRQRAATMRALASTEQEDTDGS